MRPALVTDGLLRKSLAAVRSLGKQGVPVLSAETTRLTPSAFSRHCSRSLRSPNPSTEPEAYAVWLGVTMERYGGQDAVLLPMDDDSTRITLEAIRQGRIDCCSLLPDLDAFSIASDKHRTLIAAQALGMACPRTWLPMTKEELNEPAAWGFPLVVKPRKGSGSRGIRVVASMQELTEEYLASCATGSGEPPMIQEYIEPGERYDAAVLFDEEGVMRASFVQKELRHYPVDIGPSTVQMSVYMPELAEQAAELLRFLGWRGIAEVEWMRDSKDGSLKLMEVNPRYWNSLHLAVQSGVDFPHMHYQLALGMKVPPVHDYKVGQITRNLLPGDLLHAWASKRWFDLDPPLICRRGMPIQDDIWSAKDPLASVGFAAACTRFVLDRNKWKMVLKR